MTTQPRRSYTRFAIAIIIAAVVIGAIIFALYLGIGGVNPGGSTNHIDINSISVSGLSICPNNCVYPAPYVSGEILINGSVPISSVTVSVNGTYEGLALQNPSTTTIACSTATGQICSIELEQPNIPVEHTLPLRNIMLPAPLPQTALPVPQHIQEVSIR